MTAFLSFRYPDRIEMLADGATCLSSGAFLASTDKIRVSPFLPLAVTGRGGHSHLERLAENIIKLSACESVDETLAAVCDVLEAVRDEPGESAALELVIAGYSETSGPRHFMVRSYAAGDLPAWTLLDYSGQMIGGGNLPPREEIEAAGLNASTFADGAAGGGLALMEMMRRIPGRNEHDPASLHGYWIGGHVDHAVISADGVVVNRLKTWPDVPFQLIDPARL